MHRNRRASTRPCKGMNPIALQHVGTERWNAAPAGGGHAASRAVTWKRCGMAIVTWMRQGNWHHGNCRCKLKGTEARLLARTICGRPAMRQGQRSAPSSDCVMKPRAVRLLVATAMLALPQMHRLRGRRERVSCAAYQQNVDQPCQPGLWCCSGS